MEPYVWRRIYTFRIRQPTSQHPVGSSLVIPKSPQITTDQNLYASSISPIDIKKGKSLRKNDELSQEEKTDLKWLTNQMTWLDVSFDVCMMSNTGNSIKVKLLFEANKSPLKSKSKTGSMSLPQLGKPASLNIVCYSDATYASLEDESS